MILYERGVLGLWMLPSCSGPPGPGSAGRSAWRHPEHGGLGVVLAVAAASLVSTYFEIIPMDAYFWPFRRDGV